MSAEWETLLLLCLISSNHLLSLAAEKLASLYRRVIIRDVGYRNHGLLWSKDGGIMAYEVEPNKYHVGYAA